MPIIIQPAEEAHVLPITDMVNLFAAENLMLPRTEESVRQTRADWLVAVDPDASSDAPPILACGALVPLTDTLVELRSLAVHPSQQGKGLGGHVVEHLPKGVAGVHLLSQVPSLRRSGGDDEPGGDATDRCASSDATGGLEHLAQVE